ncbi:MAG: hypothetical protein JNK78_12150 [Planctomycetes bacterium]|nr:hypothetical protein [Planctomycetota bacterium]
MACTALPTLLAPAVLAASLTAQCATQWLPGLPLTGPGGTVHSSVAWDPDGSGPLPRVLVLGGEFAAAGDVIAANVVAYEPVARTWSPLGVGLDGPVYALALTAGGDLVAGGAFTGSGPAAAARLARWNGSTWSAVGGGTSGPVYSLLALPNGDLVAGGEFASAGGVAANNIAQFDGTQWSPLGTGVTGVLPGFSQSPPAVRCLGRRSNGDLIVGGSFADAGGIPVWGGARWAGGAWQDLGVFPGLSPSSGSGVTALVVLGNDDVVASGELVGGSPVTGSQGVGRWSGTQWLPMGSASPLQASRFVELANGGILAGTFGPWPLRQWTGTTWAVVGPLEAPLSFATTITEVGPGDVLVGGFANGTRGSATAFRIVGSPVAAWVPLSPGTDGAIATIRCESDGTAVVGGGFSRIGGTAARGIARWDGSSWSSLGTGLDGPAFATARRANGDLLVGGAFGSAGPVIANGIARWNGASWSDVGAGAFDPTFTGAAIYAMATMPNGDVVVGGRFEQFDNVAANNLALWNGVSWSALGGGLGNGVDNVVRAMIVMPNGDLVVAGEFTTAGGAPAAHVARWNGTSWTPLGPGLGAGPFDSVEALAVRPNGDLVAAGRFATTGDGATAVQRIARWNGTAWSAYGNGVSAVVRSLAVLPDGDVVAGVDTFDAAGQPSPSPLRWNGTTWSTDLAGIDDRFGTVSALAFAPNGELWVGGSFASLQGAVSAGLARRTTTCAADSVATGLPCLGSAGPVTLTTTGLPWIGGALRAEAGLVPANSLVVGLIGLSTTSVPLPSILPQGVPGCSLLVADDALTLHVPAAGRVTTTFAIPDSPALPGVTFHHQVAPLEFDAQGNLLALVASNRLTLTIGSF